MAEKGFTPIDYPRHGMMFKWAGVTNTDTCTPITVEEHLNISIQAIPSGSWGSGDTVALHGSLQKDVAKASATYGPLSDGNENAISLISSKVQYVGPLAHHYKPVPGGSTGTTWDIYLLATL